MFSEDLVFFTSPIGIAVLALMTALTVLEYKMPERKIPTVVSAVYAALTVVVCLWLSVSLGETLAVALFALALRLLLALGGKKNDV